MIRCSNVSLKYSKKIILDDISFTAGDSEITVILGKNGSGKSTLLSALTGNFPYEGSIRINDHEISTLRSSKRAGLVAIMPQSLVSPDVSVSELVSFGRQPYTGISGVLTRNDRRVIQKAMADTGITDLAEKSVNCISGGEKQKAFFAMMLAQETPVILLDEPTSHLDAQYSKRFSAFLGSAAQAGKTVVAVMHDINHALDIADRIILLDNKKLIFNSDTKSFMNSSCIETVFGLKRFECCDNADCSKKQKIIFL